MSKIFEKVLKNRGFTADFLAPNYYEGVVKLPDIELAVKCIKQAVQKKEKILVYGDYDVDGVTASAVMVETLKLAGAESVETMLPDRFVDGYGMSARAVERAEKIGAKLVITVDCGSNNSEVISELKAKKIDVIVTDHHEIMAELPADALAVVNPKRADFTDGGEKYAVEDLRELAGVGVAFMVAKALVGEGMIPAGQEKWLLDLVLIGTICDSMVLNRVNRELCVYGMKVLTRTRRAGLIELMRVAKVTKITSYAIGFQIGPRLNAGGRMESAEISLNLLLSKSRVEAARLAVQLDALNTERRNEQQAALAEIEKMTDVVSQPVIVVQGKWHEGVIGIIAGRLVEKYHKPAFVLTEVENNTDKDGDGVMEASEIVLKGSGRSFGDFNLAEAIKYTKDALIGGGGHAGACGVKLYKRDLLDFVKLVNEYYVSLKLQDQERFLLVQEDIQTDSLREISAELLDELAQLEPFGNGNSEPIFRLTRMIILDVSTMGQDGKHLSVRIQGEEGHIMKLVAFSAPAEWFALEKGTVGEFWVRLTRNEWQGRIEVEGIILDIK